MTAEENVGNEVSRVGISEAYREAYREASLLDLTTAKVALRALIRNLLDDLNPDRPGVSNRDEPADGSLKGRSRQSREALFSNSPIFESSSTVPLSVVLLVGDTPLNLFNDALLALDAQSDPNFELLVVVSHDRAREIKSMEERLDLFPELMTRSRLLEGAPDLGGALLRSHDLRTGLDHANGRYVTFVDASSVVFGHFVATFARLAADSSRVLLRARALGQPLRALTWPDGRPGFEPAGGAVSISAARFNLLQHLTHRDSPTGSYAVLREFFDDDSDVDVVEDFMLIEAALLGGITEASDAAVILLRHFV